MLAFIAPMRPFRCVAKPEPIRCRLRHKSIANSSQFCAISFNAAVTSRSYCNKNEVATSRTDLPGLIEGMFEAANVMPLRGRN